MPKTRRPWLPGVFAGLLLLWQVPAAADEPDLEPDFLWPAPETNALGFSVFSGYTLAEPIEGANLGARAFFFFRYFVAAVSGEIVFVDDGPVYSLLVDLDGRYGPVRAGLLLGMCWLPGKAGAPAPDLGFELGLNVPLGLDGFWLDLSYRPNLVFLDSGELTYHSLNLGLIIEAGL